MASLPTTLFARGSTTRGRARHGLLAPTLAAALLALLAGCGSDARSGLPRPPVVLVIIDTLRADHLGCYGYALDTSPVIDALAGQATVFEANTTQCNATFSSITSIFTGLYPKTHRNYLAVSVEGQTVDNDRADTLAERLGSAGYETLAVVSHPWWREAPTDTAIGQGWDAFAPIPPAIEGPARRGAAGSAQATTDRALALLAGRDDSRPPFLWVHYFDPHTPYDPPARHRDRFLSSHLDQVAAVEHEAELLGREPEERRTWISQQTADEQAALYLANGRALYDGEIADCDEHLGRLFDRLRQDGLFDDALIVVMADHGENMEAGRHELRFTHRRLFEGVVLTPLLVKLPGQTEGQRVAALTQNIDLTPTIVELLGLPAGAAMEGASLVPLLEDAGATLHEQVFVESSDKLERAVRTEQLKLIDPGNGEPRELYRWRQDIDEQRDLMASAPKSASQELRQRLDAFRPRQVLHLRLVPDASPYRLTLALAIHKARMVVAGGPLETANDGRLLAGTLQVDSQPIDLALPLDRETPEGTLSLERAGDESLWSRLILGRTPAQETAAYPRWSTTTTRPSSPALVTLGAPPGAERQLVEIAAGAATRASLTLHVGPEGQRPALRESSGFGEPERPAGGRTLAYEASLEQGASAELQLPRGTGAALLLDGRWPHPDRIVGPDGHVMDGSRLTIVLPRDATLAAQLAEPPPASPPPGAILLWIESEGDAAEIDISLLDDERIEELRALGYLR